MSDAVIRSIEGRIGILTINNPPVNALAAAVRGVPTVIVARTVKGKGVSFAENTHTYHNNLLTKDLQEQARREIRAM